MVVGLGLRGICGYSRLPIGGHFLVRQTAIFKVAV